ncbi:hypothetical protein LPJ74_005641 [Coemansia sp. RSA 1843]|nr:hypothetical protein LPJ74_005641 [Coemansia sp. RSA 1843]
MVWLDIERPTRDDIVALAHMLLKGIGVDCLFGLECLSRDGALLYVCWAETTAHDANTDSYLAKGAFSAHAPCSAPGPEEEEEVEEEQQIHNDNDDGRGGGWIGQYIPTFPWLQPSATQIHGHF